MNSGLSTHKKLTAMGLLIAIGIVFGDIGTSPLYVMRTILRANPHFDANYILGAVSCIIWTLTLQTTLKYVIVALRADNKGEGGVLALFTLIRKRGYHWLFIVAILGASTLIADGVITPAITVTSAIEGLHGLSTDIPIVPIVLFIISTVFFIQRFGTGSIGTYFGPFMLVWFLLLGILGMIHVVDYPYIIKAFNPYYAIKLLASSPEWFLILGAVFLCTTGAEALYSDLGHCGRRNITISWIKSCSSSTTWDKAHILLVILHPCTRESILFTPSCPTGYSSLVSSWLPEQRSLQVKRSSVDALLSSAKQSI
mgnify:CR=1 FL=1